MTDSKKTEQRYDIKNHESFLSDHALELQNSNKSFEIQSGEEEFLDMNI